MARSGVGQGAVAIGACQPEGLCSTRTVQKVDVAVVGAGFAGLYLLHRLREAGFSTVVLDKAGDVGGTWYWNRYPGARCDIQTVDYSYTFDPELERVWTWSEKYATQPEILRYLGFVADRYDLRRDIRFSTRVMAATWNQAAERWLLTTDNGVTVSCRAETDEKGQQQTHAAQEINFIIRSPRQLGRASKLGS